MHFFSVGFEKSPWDTNRRRVLNKNIVGARMFSDFFYVQIDKLGSVVTNELIDSTSILCHAMKLYSIKNRQYDVW